MTKIILKHLMLDENELYGSTVYPFLKDGYFENPDENFLYKIINKYYSKYDHFPNVEEIKVLIGKSKDQSDVLRIKKILDKIIDTEYLKNDDFLLDETEEFIKHKDLELNIIESVHALSKNETAKISEIPSLIESSLAISFDKSVGMNIKDTIQDRLSYYKEASGSGFKCDLDFMNKLTLGGFKAKTLALVLGAAGVGKTILQTHLATSFIQKGHNVLYITLELSENEIFKRVDSNLLNIKMNDLKDTSADEFGNVYKEILKNGLGTLVVKEYSTGGANAIQFKSLLKELDQKQNFQPDVIFVDYLGIMAQVSDNMYDNVKKNAEQLRAMAIEFNCCVITGSQTNRGGFDKSNGIGMADIAESTGPLQIADCVLGISKFDVGEQDEEESTKDIGFVKKQKILLNVIKNRYGGLTADRFLFTQDFEYMRIVEDDNFSNNSSPSEAPTPNRGLMDKPEITEAIEDIFNF